MTENKEKKKVEKQEIFMKLLEECYQKAINGINKISPSVEEMAKEYMEKKKNPNDAAKEMLSNQITKCTTSGIITGFGGVITLPATIPANVGSVLYMQLRMIACAAYMAGLDPKSEYVKTMVYACMAGVAIAEPLKKVGVEVGQKVALGMIKKIPGKIFININKKVGFRLFTKFGEKGMINMVKLVPGVGAIVGGGFDYVQTKIIANRAYKWFFEGDFEVDEDVEYNDNIMNAEYEIVKEVAEDETLA